MNSVEAGYCKANDTLAGFWYQFNVQAFSALTLLVDVRPVKNY